jgi:ADP-heptose:LPS heptosyltransferase
MATDLVSYPVDIININGKFTAGIYLTAAEQRAARTQLGAVYRPLVVLYSDVGMAIKRWPMSSWIALGRALQQQFGATTIVPIGSDMEQAEQIVRAIGGAAQLWQRGSLRQLAAGMATADLVIAADTGAARIAAALNVPTITLFGPSWHGRYGQPVPHINLQGYPACPERVIQNFTEQCCWYQGVCPIADWHTCLEDISVTTVLEAAHSLLTQTHTESQTSIAISHPITVNSTTALDWRSVRNLLVMRLDNIGDVIMTSPALRALRANLPQAKITLLASPGGALTAELLPWIDEVLPWRVLWQDLGRLEFNPDREWQFIQTLHDRQFDAAIIFTSFSQTPHPAALISTLAGIPLRLGESKEQDIGTLTHALSPAPMLPTNCIKSNATYA